MTASSADDSRAQDQIIVDANGVMRWEGTNEEVHLFGVNYTTPFSSAYQYHKKLGVSIKQAIDLDVAQMARLGFDGFRLHVWDVEISNSSGNLLDNEHLDLLDYLLARLAEHGIKSILTPLVWYSSSEQSVTMGFCQFHPKREAITDENARKAERTYLAQFVQHTNPYRKIAYKDDPSIVALEIFNEPDHPEDPQATIGYINEMAKVLRTAGFAKPLFYNIAEVWSEMQEANVSTQACVDGFSFQWYPTSLVFRKMHHGNHLMNVSRYAIPAADDPGALSKAKIVYEFDAADIGGSYMYPAMVRGFREAGMQFAAMFTYDPSQLAWGNIEFPTHFMNLLYTPSKAISLMIAGKAFRGLPRLVDHGGYPDNSRFGDFRVSYEEDLSELNSATEFLYSNRTQSQPTNPHRLQRVSGCGCSPLVEYDGTGAYFLDKLEPGIWRLELYPDVLWLDDPFGATGMSRQVARLFWGQRRMTVSIPDLGDDYTTYPLGTSSTGSRERATTRVGASEPIGRSLAPGVYLLAATTAGAEKIKPYLSSPQEPFLDGLYTPAPFGSGVYVVNRTNRYAIDSTELEFRFSIAAEREISRASLFVRRVGEGKFTKHPLEKCGGFDYVATDATAASREICQRV